MENKKPNRRETERKLFYVVFSLFLCLPLGGYIYNFQEYRDIYRTEIVKDTISNKKKSCIRFSSIIINEAAKTIQKTSYKFALLHYGKTITDKLHKQGIIIKVLLINKLFFLNKYCSLDEDDFFEVKYIS